MMFWQRRPVVRNLVGIALVLLVWFVLELLVDVLLETAGITGITRQRGSLLPVLVATIAVTRYYDRMNATWAGIGLHRWMPRELGIGLALGFAMAALAWLPIAVTSLVARAPSTEAGLVAEVAIYFLLGAITEELVFRGYIFQRLIEIFGPLIATLAASALFAAAHLENPSISPVAMMNIFLASIFFSLGYLITGSLWLPIAAHAAWNLTLALVLGVPVSGIDLDVGLLRAVEEGPDILDGGAFGPEGGLLTTIALAAGILALVRIPSITLSPYVHARVFRSVYRDESERGTRR